MAWNVMMFNVGCHLPTTTILYMDSRPAMNAWALSTHRWSLKSSLSFPHLFICVSFLLLLPWHLFLLKSIWYWWIIRKRKRVKNLIDELKESEWRERISSLEYNRSIRYVLSPFIFQVHCPSPDSSTLTYPWVTLANCLCYKLWIPNFSW